MILVTAPEKASVPHNVGRLSEPVEASVELVSPLLLRRQSALNHSDLPVAIQYEFVSAILRTTLQETMFLSDVDSPLLVKTDGSRIGQLQLGGK